MQALQQCIVVLRCYHAYFGTQSDLAPNRCPGRPWHFASSPVHKGRTILQSFGRFRVVESFAAILFRALDRTQWCEIHFCGPSMSRASGPQVIGHIWTRSVPILFKPNPLFGLLYTCIDKGKNIPRTDTVRLSRVNLVDERSGPLSGQVLQISDQPGE